MNYDVFKYCICRFCKKDSEDNDIIKECDMSNDVIDECVIEYIY